MDMRSHELNYCENPRVPCRNAFLGCEVFIRLKSRHLHENVTGDRQIRSCLYVGGRGVHLDLDEDDLPCPWTAEVLQSIDISLPY
jgi:hypothetical protein